MSQAPDMNISANPSGLAMRGEINQIFAALNSLNKGASRPASVTAGTMWIDDSDDPTWKVYFFDGSNDLEFLVVDSDAHTFTISPHLSLDSNPGLEYNVDALRVKADNSTIERAAGGIQLKDGGTTLAKLAAHTIGEVLGFTTAGAAAAIAAGATGQVLRATTGAAAAFAYHGGDFGRLLASNDFSTSSGGNTGANPYWAVNIDGSFPTLTMFGYKIHFASDNTDLGCFFSINAGASTLTGLHNHTQTLGAGSASYSASASTSNSFVPIAVGAGNNSEETIDFLLHFYNYNSGTKRPGVFGFAVYRDTSGVVKGGMFIGGPNSGSLVNLFAVGSAGLSTNIDSGIMLLYGNGTNGA